MCAVTVPRAMLTRTAWARAKPVLVARANRELAEMSAQELARAQDCFKRCDEAARKAVELDLLPPGWLPPAFFWFAYPAARAALLADRGRLRSGLGQPQPVGVARVARVWQRWHQWHLLKSAVPDAQDEQSLPVLHRLDVLFRCRECAAKGRGGGLHAEETRNHACLRPALTWPLSSDLDELAPTRWLEVMPCEVIAPAVLRAINVTQIHWSRPPALLLDVSAREEIPLALRMQISTSLHTYPDLVRAPQTRSC